MGWPGIAEVFDHYRGVLDACTDAQREAVAGFEESNAAIEHYFHAYEAWLDALSRTIIRPSDRQPSSPAHQRFQSEERQDRRATGGSATGQSTSVRSYRDRGQTTDIESLRERVTNLEHRQQAMEDTLKEIHAEVVQ